MIDLSPQLNVAKDDALRQAQYRANREKAPMFVFVGGPDCESTMTNERRLNIWYVRNASEGTPEGAELYQTVAPKSP